jgi:hypothetical protein
VAVRRSELNRTADGIYVRNAAAAGNHTGPLAPLQCATNNVGIEGQYMSSLRGTGVLREFNRAYKQRRMAATARGRGFMTFKVAEQRLKAALIPLLMNGGKPVVGQSLFAEVFGDK